MRIIKPDAVIINDDEMNPYQKIERCGRICYKSEDKITNESAEKFVKNMIEHRHTAMLEHSHIYLCIREGVMSLVRKWLETELTSRRANIIIPYLNITSIRHRNYKYTLLSGSFRTFINMFDFYFTGYTANCGMDAIYIELNKAYGEVFPNKNTVAPSIASTNEVMRWRRSVILFKNAKQFINDIKTMDGVNNDVLSKHIVHSIVFTCDRGVSHEIIRHRPCSFAQESTRYCCYSKDKFGNEITVIEPCFYERDSDSYKIWKEQCESAEKAYLSLIENKSSAQQARSVLPNSLKTEIVVTATENEWKHILNLRKFGTTGAPHPQTKEIMDIAYPLLVEASNNRITL